MDWVDGLSQVEITQEYHNDEEITLECIYEFPIFEKAAITNFTAIVEGREIVAIAKSK